MSSPRRKNLTCEEIGFSPASLIKLQNISLAYGYHAIREFKQLHEIIKAKSEHSLTFSEAKSISSSPYAILTLQSDEFTIRPQAHQCISTTTPSHSEATHGKLVTSVRRD